MPEITPKNAPVFNTVKILAIENLRGMAALMVCIFHMTGNSGFLPGSPIKQISIYGYLGVQIFFVISGFVIPWSLYNSHYKIKSFFRYLLRRVLRIEPPYLASIFLLIGLNWISSKTGLYKGLPFHFNLPQLLTHFIYLPEFFGFLWLQPIYHTLLVEFQFYILVGLIFPLLISSKKTILLGLLIVLVGCRFLINWGVFLNIGLFLIGMIFFLYKIGHLKNNEMRWLEIFVLIFILITDNDISVAITGLLSLIGMVYWINTTRITTFLGKISYSLYLIHIPIGGRVINLSMHYAHTAYSPYMILIIAVLTSIIFAWLFYRVIELPALRLSKYIKY